ncbi:MAG TPA: cupin domain-containing protein [Polyangiaceae bacterium]|jgi:uncharacterized cupin superfamily protein
MSERRHARVVNVDEIEPMKQERGGFASVRRRLGAGTGGGALGASHTEVAPGKTAFPFHYHSAIEEALFILEGTGTLRIGKDTVKVRAGDWVAFPPGPDTCHALTNDGATPLRYLALSGAAIPTTIDVVAYPDSKKIAFAAGVDPKKGIQSGWLFKLIREDQPPLDYYEDEPLAKK